MIIGPYLLALLLTFSVILIIFGAVIIFGGIKEARMLGALTRVGVRPILVPRLIFGLAVIFVGVGLGLSLLKHLP